MAETHGSERSWAASAEETVRRGDWRVRLEACTAATAREAKSQESGPTMVDVGERDAGDASGAAPRRVTPCRPMSIRAQNSSSSALAAPFSAAQNILHEATRPLCLLIRHVSSARYLPLSITVGVMSGHSIL